ncbi:hypothetical protein QTH76_13675 [Clostridium perfringens]|nr:hypothetical protein [Clostridium perfringens]
MSKLELCSKCHKYKSNLNDEGICAECEVVEYDNQKEMDIKIGEQFLIDNSMYIEVMYIEEYYIEYKKVYLDGKFDGTIYRMERAAFKERAIPMDRVIVKDKVIKEKPKMKCEVLDSKYSHRLREAIQCFLEKNTVEEVISLSCYFDSSTDYHVAVIIYK